MSSFIIISIIIAVLIILGIFVWLYLFNIYETKIAVNPRSLTSNFDSPITISVIPLNSFGREIFLRNISARFDLGSGNDLVKIKEKVANRIELKSLSLKGKVEIFVTPEFGLFPSKIEIEIIDDSVTIDHE